MAVSLGTKSKTTASKKVVATPTARPVDVRLTPSQQRLVKVIRTNRDTKRDAEAQADTARKQLLDSIGAIETSMRGTDASGKTLLKISVIPSSEKVDWTSMEKENPELFETIMKLAKPYKLERGSGEPTIRVDIP